MPLWAIGFLGALMLVGLVASVRNVKREGRRQVSDGGASFEDGGLHDSSSVERRLWHDAGDADGGTDFGGDFGGDSGDGGGDGGGGGD